MIDFSEKLEEYLQQKVIDWVGSGSTLTNPVVTVDDHLHGFNEVDPDPFPFVVVSVRQAESQAESEIGVSYDLWSWTVHFYYIDSRSDYITGKSMRKTVIGTLIKQLEKDRRIGGFDSVDDDGAREYVYDSKIDAVLFDVSGQEEYYTFVSELYLNLYTAKN